MRGESWCYAHHPDLSEKRSTNGRRGGKRSGRGRPAKSGAEGLQDIRDLLKRLTEEVLSGDLERATAIAANQLLNTSLRAIELERKWKEIEELESRLEALEGVLKGRSKAG
jgi:hypothetical protein